MQRIFGIIVLVLISSSYSWAQRTCATDELENLNKTPDQLSNQRLYFENWIENKKLERFSTNSTEGLNETTIYTIPVVVHIIHRGEPVGFGTNITDEQVFAQIEALNLDFRHLNADSVNTPANFQPLMADTGFEFILAKSDPMGFKTTGITRTAGNKEEWFFSDNTELKALSYWNSDDFLNIWVAPLGDYLGWAEFPTSTIIPGVNEEALNNPLTDGVVVRTTTFGSETLYPQGDYNSRFNQGRTLTHELGHFFGLRHIWGDEYGTAGCNVDDFVEDTPKTFDSYFNCPTTGTTEYSCNNEPSMFMNYMDYVDDECMNLFTPDQKDRMEIVLNNSPRRASLLVSPGLEEPPPLDLAITSIVSPELSICSNQITPQFEVINNGTATINVITASFMINNLTIIEKEFATNLEASESMSLVFDSYSFDDYGLYQVDYSILSVNDGLDDNTENNQIGIQVAYNETVTMLDEEFTEFPQSWAVRSSAPVSQWNLDIAPNVVAENTAVVLNYYNKEAQSDQLFLPILNLTGISDAAFIFDYAYSNREDLEDELAVVLSVDCGINFTDTLFRRSGDQLAFDSTPVKFTPSGRADWQTVVLDLSSYSNQNVQLAFAGYSEGGNNIYLDNFHLVDNNYTDIAIIGLLNESGAFDKNLDELSLIIANQGAAAVSTFELLVKEGSELLTTISISETDLAPMEQQIIRIPNTFKEGASNISFELVTDDQNLSNNQISIVINNLSDQVEIPFRENFISTSFNESNNWTISTLGDDNSWQYENGSLKLDIYSIGNKGLQDWLVLPQLDFSNASEAGLRFKVAYAQNTFNHELLRIWVSDNGGESFEYLVGEFTGLEMATAVSGFEWSPSADEDWQYQFIDLSNFAGEQTIFIGFEATDGDGNNIYLDDIELFVSGDEDLIELPIDEVATYPNPITDIYSKITFNLLDKQDITVRILDVRGQVISTQVFENVLNQTYPLELGNQRNGIYFIDATGSSFSNTMRVLVNR